jgi:alpha-amylase
VDEILRFLPGELADRGVKPVLPTRVIDSCRSAGEIDVPETTSWSDIEKDTSAWMGNDRQLTAFRALRSAKMYAVNNKPIWRCLQASDHFYAIASKFGTSGEMHAYVTHHDADEAFRSYMRILADFESRSIPVMKNRSSAKVLRVLPPELAFHFAGPTGRIGHAAYDLDQFADLLNIVPKDSLHFHEERGDFRTWIGEVIGDPVLAGSVSGISERHELVMIVRERLKDLWGDFP